MSFTNLIVNNNFYKRFLLMQLIFTLLKIRKVISKIISIIILVNNFFFN